MLGAIKQLVIGIIFLFMMKSLVYFGVFDVNEINNPLKVQIDLKGLELLNSDNQSNIFKIVNGKAEIKGKYFGNYDLVEINGKTYVVDLGIDKVNLKEYSLIERVKRNFHLLNEEPKFAWAYYIRVAIVIFAVLIFIVPGVGFLYGLFLLLVQIGLLTIPVFLIVGLLGWTGWLGFSIYIIFLLIDIYLGFVQGGE